MKWLILGLFLSSGSPIWAEPNPGVLVASAASSSLGSYIEQAQELALKKNRREAARVLNHAIEASPISIKTRARLVETLNSLARVFFSDKGQRLYEAGQSAMFDNPDVALARFREALALEDFNILILNSLAETQLAKQDCGGALRSLQQARELSVHLAEPALLELRALVCQRNFEALREKAKSLPPVEKSQEDFVSYFLAQDFLQQKMAKRSLDLLTRVSEAQPKFPEVYYWLHRASVELDRVDEIFGQKYLLLCKAITPRERKLYALEPRLCSAVKEVEDELSKKNVEP